MMPAGGERIPNDHSDPDYDRDIVDRLGALHERAREGRSSASPGSTRASASTCAGSTHAYDKVLAGEHDWVSGARIDSYHTVWFELHEDLLRMLGREREERRDRRLRARRRPRRRRPSRDREVVGNKGASIARMRALGLPVPPAFVLPIEECRRFHAARRQLDDDGLGGGARRASPASSATPAAGSATPRRRCSSPSARAPR